MAEAWRLVLSFVGPMGENYNVAMGLSSDVAGDVVRGCKPPDPFTLGGWDDAISIMRRREFRKNLFIEACTNMGTLLAERMEDKEGWHGVERSERLEAWGR